MWTAISAFFGRVFAALIGRWLVRQDAKKDQQAETQVITLDEALQRERKRDEVDRNASGSAARKRLRDKWSRPD